MLPPLMSYPRMLPPLMSYLRMLPPLISQSSGTHSHPIITESGCYPAGDEYHSNLMKLTHILSPPKADASQLVMGILFNLVGPFPSYKYDLAEIAALCPVYLPDGINVDRGLPLEPFLHRVLSIDLDFSWIRACCFLLLNVYAMKSRQPGIGDFRLLTVVHNMQMYHHTVFMMIMGETMCWVRDIALNISDFNVHHRGCPLLLQAWALDKLSLIPPVPTRLIPTYGSAIFQSRSQRHFDFGDDPTIRWTYPWWRVGLVTTGSMNLNYVLYASLDRSMAYFPDRTSRQHGMIQRVPRTHNFESGVITPHLLTTLADCWRNRNTMYLNEGTVQDTVTPAYANWFFTS
ncbi:hypothetical protein JCGZ_24378 [Jatropha curcas]|uniref:Aminotransferase-like plant mobile domain-containing protein n=1 Tax=Jatropha curcas TaxID=180498 RepID=A0A067LET3_JATCU|nr:hypothetical protein JCGZ_24378 [Jatropha curcas]